MNSTTIVNPHSLNSDDESEYQSLVNSFSFSLDSSSSDNESENESDKFSIDNFFNLMRFERLRLITYILYGHKWPKIDQISPSLLAKAGFFYVENDSVQCAFCRGIIQHWNAGEIPMEEHRRHFPHCPFVNGKYVGNVSLELDPQVYQNGKDVNVETYQEPIQIKYNKSIVPVFPMFADQENRTKTFLSKNWKSKSNLDIEKLVEAGFFFTGKNDATRCYHCGGVLCNWKLHEIPMEEHALFFPECSFIIIRKGADYLEFVKFKKEIIEMRSQIESSDKMKIRDIQCLRKITFENFLQIKQAAAKLLTKLGIRQHNSSYSYYQEYMKKFNFFVDCQKLFQYFLDMKVMKSTNKDSDSESNASLFSLLDSLDSDYSSGNSDDDSSNEEELEKLAKKPDSKALANLPKLTCSICYDNEIEVVFLPCGHQLSCMKCSNELMKCPICREYIDKKIRTYFAFNS